MMLSGIIRCQIHRKRLLLKESYLTSVLSFFSILTLRFFGLSQGEESN